MGFICINWEQGTMFVRSEKFMSTEYLKSEYSLDLSLSHSLVDSTVQN